MYGLDQLPATLLILISDFHRPTRQGRGYQEAKLTDIMTIVTVMVSCKPLVSNPILLNLAQKTGRVKSRDEITSPLLDLVPTRCVGTVGGALRPLWHSAPMRIPRAAWEQEKSMGIKHHSGFRLTACRNDVVLNYQFLASFILRLTFAAKAAPTILPYTVGAALAANLSTCHLCKSVNYFCFYMKDAELISPLPRS